MTLLCKNKALYVKACIIQNGVPDADGDTLNSEDIKKIFTSFNNQNHFEINHNEIPINEVSLMENYISETEEVIAGKNIPRGSWNCVIRVDNPTVKQRLLRGEFGGVSLNNRVQEKCAKNLNGEIDYKDVKDMECIIPLLISFVGEPANRVGLHIMDYSTYIRKSKNKVNNISDIVKSDNMSLLEKLKSIIAEEEEADAAEISKEEEQSDTADDGDAEPVIEKADEDTSTEEPEKEEDEEEEEDVSVEKSDDETETETEEETPADDVEIEKSEDAALTNETIQKEEEDEEEDGGASEEEPSIEDEEDKILALENRITAIEQKLDEVLGANNPIDVDEVPNNADEPLITKSSKIEVVEQKVSNFYEMSGRDPITGKRIRKQSRILN